MEIKYQLDATDVFYCRSYCLLNMFRGTIMPIIRSSRVLYGWFLPVGFGALVFKFQVSAARKPDTQPSAPHHTYNLKTKAPNTTGSNHLYNTLELLMMGIMVPETCWANNKICNKYHLLHLVGILFPDIRLQSSEFNGWTHSRNKSCSYCVLVHYPVSVEFALSLYTLSV